MTHQTIEKIIRPPTMMTAMTGHLYMEKHAVVPTGEGCPDVRDGVGDVVDRVADIVDGVCDLALLQVLGDTCSDRTPPASPQAPRHGDVNVRHQCRETKRRRLPFPSGGYDELGLLSGKKGDE
ncbi:hypothetical protein BN1708_006450 [Verticillium longisporum]|uniref:Uncharacterized protein n=1 Tax=Verticillium longisporum TaxID=100787 RepID=A0A0G4MK31_VERLO|nr:hypothetical protein BN1708_006450 [Verticillium longisporum]